MERSDATGELPSTGLTADEVQQRIAAGDINVAQDGPSRTTAEILRANILTTFNLLLFVLLLVVLLVVRQPKDALFGIVLVSNTAIGVVQELRAKRTLDRLQVVAAPRVRVIRAGRPSDIASDQVVIDDVIDIKTGDQVPVDGVVIQSRGLEADESLLTGESDTVHKSQGTQLLSGSFVASGSGRFRATAVGSTAYAAKLANEARRFTLVRSELRDGIDWIIRMVSIAVVPMIGILVWGQMRADESFSEALSGAIAGTVGMIPQGLVLLTSVAFAVGVVRLGQRNVLVKELPAIEGLARVDTVCFDKTGTLTEGDLAVSSIVRFIDVGVGKPLAALANAEPHPNPTLSAIGDAYPTDPGWATTASVPFSSERKWSGATFNGHETWLLGAPSILGHDQPDVLRESQKREAEGQRVLLLSRSTTALTAGATTMPANRTPIGLVMLSDQIRPDAAETLEYFRNQGVTVKVISGDAAPTVQSVAKAVGVPRADRAIDARTLPEDPQELADIVEHNAVFGRVTPHQKQAMVAALQSRGHVVAMTGDGVNDVLALKDSDIGIAIGSGAAASIAVAQLVLLDGRFSQLPEVVAEGRRVISNIERVANLFMTKTIYAIVLAIAIGIVALPFPFLPRHLTLVGAITIGIPAFFLALAPTTVRTTTGFLQRVFKFAVPTGMVAAIATFGAYQLAISEGVDIEPSRTTAVLVLTAIGLFALAIVSRPLVPWKKGLIGAMAGLLFLSLTLGGSRTFFELAWPRPVVMLAALGIVAVTGVAMVATLRTVGWIKRVPSLLRDHPPSETPAWRRIRGTLRPPPVAAKVAPPSPDPVTWLDVDEELEIEARQRSTN